MTRFITTCAKIIAAILLTLTASPALFAGPPAFEVSWYTIDGGGAMFSTGGAYELGGTIAQPDAQVAPVMTGGMFQLTGGFWPVSNVCYCLADMNADGKKDGADAQKFVNCVLTGGDCSCADVDQANGVTAADVDVFVADLLAGPACP